MPFSMYYYSGCLSVFTYRSAEAFCYCTACNNHGHLQVLVWLQGTWQHLLIPSPATQPLLLLLSHAGSCKRKNPTEPLPGNCCEATRTPRYSLCLSCSCLPPNFRRMKLSGRGSHTLKSVLEFFSFMSTIFSLPNTAPLLKFYLQPWAV